MRPRLHSVYFGGPEWDRLANVLRRSARAYNPGWDVQVHNTCGQQPHAQNGRGRESFVANTNKMAHWRSTVAGSPLGARLLLIDADTMILRNLDDVWDTEFDVAYTARDPKQSRFPYNSGVVFVRVRRSVRAWINDWYAENVRMLSDQGHHAVYRRKYGGINQAALGAMLERDQLAGLKVLALPCREWNCEDSEWRRFNGETRIIHVKSQLRKVVLNGSLPTSKTPSALRDRWLEFEGLVRA